MNKHAKNATAKSVSVAEAKAHLSELLALAASGKVVEITKHGKPYVFVEAAVKNKPKRLLGAAKGKLWMADDFDELGPEWDEYTKP